MLNFLKDVVLHSDETKKEGSEAEKQVSSNQGLKQVIPQKKVSIPLWKLWTYLK